MRSRDLVRPLEEDWRDTLDAVARGRGWPTSHEPAKIASQLARLSAAYNAGGDEARATREATAARLVFSFARDVPKGAAAVRELVASGALAMPAGGRLRVLDLGAGLGATTWGLVRALEAAGAEGEIDATWVDEDARALEVATAILRARHGEESRVRLVARTVTGAASLASTRGARFDLVLLGQVLSELDRDADDRLARHVSLVRTLLESAVEPHGSLVILEPALRDRTRHLESVRDALLAAAIPGRGEVTVFAPCLHEAPCPALAASGDWCHEDLSVDLPRWLVPIAQSAGLRWQGLTFSYLVLRRDGHRLLDALPRGGSRVRLVSGPLVSKGKREAFVCGELDEEGATRFGRARAMRLDRDAVPSNEAWERAERGELLAVEPPLVARRARIDREGRVVRLDPERREPAQVEPREGAPAEPSVLSVDVAPGSQ